MLLREKRNNTIENFERFKIAVIFVFDPSMGEISCKSISLHFYRHTRNNMDIFILILE